MKNKCHGKHGEFRIDMGEGYVAVVYDNTKNGLTEREAKRIANKVVGQPIFWSDDRRCNWMFDFKVGNHWSEVLFHNNGVPDDVPDMNPVHINVYE